MSTAQSPQHQAQGQPLQWPSFTVKRDSQHYLNYVFDQDEGEVYETGLPHGPREAWKWLCHDDVFRDDLYDVCVAVMVGPGDGPVTFNQPLFHATLWSVWTVGDDGTAVLVGYFPCDQARSEVKRIIAEGGSPIVTTQYCPSYSDWDAGDVQHTPAAPSVTTVPVGTVLPAGEVTEFYELIRLIEGDDVGELHTAADWYGAVDEWWEHGDLQDEDAGDQLLVVPPGYARPIAVRVIEDSFRWFEPDDDDEEDVFAMMLAKIKAQDTRPRLTLVLKRDGKTIAEILHTRYDGCLDCMRSMLVAWEGLRGVLEGIEPVIEVSTGERFAAIFADALGVAGYDVCDELGILRVLLIRPDPDDDDYEWLEQTVRFAPTSQARRSLVRRFLKWREQAESQGLQLRIVDHKDNEIAFSEIAENVGEPEESEPEPEATID